MSNDNKIFEDFYKLAGSVMSNTINTASEFKESFEASVSRALDSLLKKKDLVTREEFEVVKDMLVKSRQEQEKIKKELSRLKGKK